MMVLSLSFIACTREEKFPQLGLNFAGPIDVASDGEYFYVLNSDTERTYNKGSLMVIDEKGARLAAVEIPRLARVMHIAGKDLIIGVAESENDGSHVLLFDISNPEAPQKKARLDIDCIPYGIAARENYAYFVVSCLGGSIYVGEFAEDRSASLIYKSRSFGVTRRAIHIDTTNNLAYLFPTNPSSQSRYDQLRVDSYDYNEEGVATEGSNEIPDDFEVTLRDRNNLSQREFIQFVVLDLTREKSEGFVYKTNATHPEIAKERRWLYFNLENFDGHPDVDGSTVAGYSATAYKYYRTNFWMTRPDPTDPNSFFISHRGLITGSPHANNIVRVSIVGDPFSNRSTGEPAITSSFLQFERVYGFSGEAQKWHYPSAFDVGRSGGETFFLINHFQDLDTKRRNQSVEYGLSARPIYGFDWLQESHDVSPSNAFYQVALNKRGYAMSCLFYTNAMVLFQVSPFTGPISFTKLE